MSKDFITLQRRVLDSWLWDMPAEQSKVALTLLLMANWKSGTTFSNGKLVKIERGQVLTSVLAVSTRSRTTERTTRTALKNLELAGFLTSRTTNKFTVITIVNYTEKQPGEPPDRQAERQANTKEPPSNRQAERQTNAKEPSKIEEGKKGIIKEGNNRNTHRAGAREGVGKDIVRLLADEIWQEQEDLRLRLKADGIGKATRGLPHTSPFKLELLHRISERLAASSIDDAREDCLHVLAVREAEARAQRSLRWLSGAHWNANRFTATLAMEIGESISYEKRKNKSAVVDMEEWMK